MQMWRKKVVLGGIIVMTLLGLGLSNSSKHNFEYHSKIKNVRSIKLNSDFSNIKVVSNSPDLQMDVQSQKTILGEPNIDITYRKDEAIITVLTIKKDWKKILPSKRNKSDILLNIPPDLLDDIHLATKNGNIDVNQVTGVSRLSLTTDVGTIKMNSFQGELLTINSGNGSIHLGEIDGQINIRNKVGSLKSLTFKNINGKNDIIISNGNVKVQLPDVTKMDEIGLNISTKNGKIISKDHKLNMIHKGSGKEVLNNPLNHEAKLNISVLVGNIEIN